MRIILEARVANLGNVGDMVTVKPGYARNYLFPQGMALPATKENIVEFEKHRVELEKKAAEILAEAKVRAEKLAATNVTIETMAGEEGKLFGSIGPRDIAEAVTAAGVELCKSEVTLPEGPIRMIGEHEVVVKLHSEVDTTIKVNVVGKAEE